MVLDNVLTHLMRARTRHLLKSRDEDNDVKMSDDNESKSKPAVASNKSSKQEEALHVDDEDDDGHLDMANVIRALLGELTSKALFS